MGVVDTLTAGFSAVIRKPWLLLLPVLVDLGLYLGPKVSVRPVYDRWSAALEELLASSTTTAMTPTNAELVREQLALIRDAAGGFNILSLLSVNRLMLPSVAGLRPIDAEVDHVIALADPSRALASLVLILVVGLFLTCVYLGLLAQQARGQQASLVALAQSAPLYWLRMMGVAGILALALLVLLVVAMLVALTAQLMIMIGIGPLGGLLLMVFMLGIYLVGIWLFFYLFFVPQAVTLAEATPGMALRQSFVVVRMGLWRALVFVVLTQVISTGLGYLWERMMLNQIGTIAAIVANAFVGTGLLAAMYIFFRDRLVALHQLQQIAQKTA